MSDPLNPSRWALVEHERELAPGIQLLGLYCSNCGRSHVFRLRAPQGRELVGRWWWFEGTCLDMLPGNLDRAVQQRRLFRRVGLEDVSTPAELADLVPA